MSDTNPDEAVAADQEEITPGVVENTEEPLPETEAIETEAVETEAVETEAVETEAVETEAAETDAVETEAVETEAVETEAVETEVEETDAIEPDAIETEQNEGQQPVEEENVEEAAAEEEMPIVTDEVEQRTDEAVTDDMATATEPTAEEHEVDPHAPSPTPRGPDEKFDRDATATVKFVLLPSGQVATLRCHLGQCLLDLKQHFAGELKMPIDALLFIFDGQQVSNDVPIGELGVGPNGTVQLEIQSADPINQPIRPFKPKQEYTMPDVITVRVPADDGSYREVVVEIERLPRKKPFLGGFRHKETSAEFHHASAQTSTKVQTVSNVERNCRDTQTVEQRHAPQQTTNHTATQMTKIGCYVSNMEDRLVVPGPYTTADEHIARKLQQVVIIQKYYRRWLAQRYVVQVRDDKSKRLDWEREEELRKKKEKEDRIRREFERRMNPKSKEDFDLLYHALEKWRNEEREHIEQTLSGAERKAALCQLLEQETQLIASIGRHKIEADTENRGKHIHAFLDKAAAPKRWKGGDGKVTEMDTPYTIRAQQLRDIYNSINMKYLTQDERLDVLLTLKHTVKEHDCKLTKEIIELIDREADLLMRGIRENSLDGLRKRIATLFLQYIKTPTFNPEAARLLKVPQDPMDMRKDIYFCSGCNQYLPTTEFQLASNSRSVGRCRKCTKTDNDARVRQDYSHYRFMLKTLRRNEEAYGDGSKIAYLLQENDLRHLVENVWNSQSALSAWDDLYDLLLVRWDSHSEWAPWNCVLLTKEEASAHSKLDNMEEAYGRTFIHRVKHKHTLARNYFSRLPGMAEYMRASSTPTSRAPSVAGRALTTQLAKAY